jgi:hypothetical protein
MLPVLNFSEWTMGQYRNNSWVYFEPHAYKDIAKSHSCGTVGLRHEAEVLSSISHYVVCSSQLLSSAVGLVKTFIQNEKIYLEVSMTKYLTYVEAPLAIAWPSGVTIEKEHGVANQFSLPLACIGLAIPKQSTSMSMD